MARRYGLRARLVAGTVLVATAAVAATAWLAVYGTTTSINRQQESVRGHYPYVYQALIDYAATHPDWTSAGPLIAGLSADLAHDGLRIALTTADGRPVVGPSGAPGSAGTAYPSVAVDPLTIDRTLAAVRFRDGINPLVVGPFQLTPPEHGDLTVLAERAAACLRRHRVAVDVAEVTSGRPYLRIPEARAPRACTGLLAEGDGYVGFSDSPTVTPTATERAALRQLALLARKCIDPRGAARLSLDGTGQVTTGAAQDPKARQCLVDARRQMLRSYVAPTAFLSIVPAGDRTGTEVGLSSAGALRIAGAAGIVAVLTVGVALLLADRVIRPVHALTVAARRMRAGDRSARAGTTAGWEIAELTAAFNEMAEHVAGTERQRRELTSDISHELRNPLNTIRGWLIAAHDGVADLDPELVSSLLAETALLHRLVDDLRDLALADAGELRLEPVELNLADLLRHVAATGSGRVTVQAPPRLLLVADPIRIRQAVGNLVANAERYTPPDGSITVRARRVESVVVIDVADTGPGIAAADLPHVFDRFWRADKSRNRRTGGTGLGLAVVRKLAEAHGGTVSAVSTPGAGSTFTLRLPAAKEPA
ncbi:sensor histidine kinase [Pseudosporangium ferrugineum]|uniref:histidine kinase n=1 Tax=Pseudosporangium ferrugineum TaxID=439699 RepID=A0A2T0SFD5_9ACTN|nr:HAMP domain-containing sensor histidine kinase [Pseudosporangium ferrugineum]PRY32119.1 two-component system sensor histidine kinase BaeS [Pseudosporangium ferrugineum]